MTVTIDNAGRIVIPKAIRDREGLKAGTEFEIYAENGRIELEAAYAPVRLEERDGLLVAVPDPRAPKMTDEMVNELGGIPRSEARLQRIRDSGLSTVVSPLAGE